MINTVTLELNAASDVTFRKNGEHEYGTLLGIQNVYAGRGKSTKLPLSVLLQANCVEYARQAALVKGIRFIVQGRLTFSELHGKYTLKADQLTVLSLSKSKSTVADESVPDDAAVAAPEKESNPRGKNPKIK